MRKFDFKVLSSRRLGAGSSRAVRTLYAMALAARRAGLPVQPAPAPLRAPASWRGARQWGGGPGPSAK